LIIAGGRAGDERQGGHGEQQRDASKREVMA
jgi:hypothetical protein